MDERRFSAILEIKVSGLVEAYMDSTKASLEDALKTIYGSKLYKTLEREETKVWHFSSALLLDCMMQELETGVLRFPDE